MRGLFCSILNIEVIPIIKPFIDKLFFHSLVYGIVLSRKKRFFIPKQQTTKDVALAGFWGILDDAWCADPNASTDDGSDDDEDGSSSPGSPGPPPGSPAVGPAAPPVLALEDGVVGDAAADVDEAEDVGVAAATAEQDGHDLRMSQPDLELPHPNDVGVAAASHPDDLQVTEPELPHPPCDIFGRPVASPAFAGSSRDARAEMQAKVLAKFESLKTGLAEQLFLRGIGVEFKELYYSIIPENDYIAQVITE